MTRIGKICKWANLLLTEQGTTLLGAAPTGEADDILSQYEARRDLVLNLQSAIQSQSASVVGWISTLTAIANLTLADLQLALNAPSNSVNVILPLMYADMVANGQTIKANTIATPTATAAGANVGTGKLLLSKKNVLGNDDERIIVETLEAVCTNDRFSGTAAGSEVFSVAGFPKLGNPGLYGTRGNGNGPSLRVADSANLIANGAFTTFVAVPHVPDSWTLVAGIAVTNIDQESTNFHQGASALKYIGDGSTGTVTITQVINTAVLPSTIYGLSIWLRKGGTVNTGSTLNVKITGTGFTTVNLYSADPNGLTTSYVNFSAFFPTGVVIPTNLTVTITWTSAASAGATAIIYMDDLVMAIPTAFGAVQYMLVRGSTDFSDGDSFSVTTSSSYNGVFQTYFGRFFNFQLPSNAVGGETQADSLAT